MAGLLTPKPPQGDGMPQGMAQEQMPPEQAAPQNEEADPEVGEAANQAVDFMKSALYENSAGESFVQGLKRSQDKVEAIANYAYELADVAGERVGGVEPEDVIYLGAVALAEIGEIAQAVDSNVDDVTIAQAFSVMIERFAGELGVDTKELRMAMDQYTPEMLKQAITTFEGEEQNVSG